MDRSEESRDRKRAGFSLSQETITILTVGVALAGIIVATYGDMRSEARAEREAMRSEARADRARIETSMNLMRTEGRADREAFAKQITRLVEQQGTLNGLVEGLRSPVPSSYHADSEPPV